MDSHKTAAEDTYHLGIKALMRDKDGKILLLQVNPAALSGMNKSYWDLPGGRVQKDSSVSETLKREVLEETGISDLDQIQSIGMVLSNIRIPVGKQTVGLILGVYSCTASPNQTITLSDEHIGYEWFTPKDASDLLKIKYPEDFCRLIATL